MTAPENPHPQVIAHDPVAHAKLDALDNQVRSQGQTLGTILSVLTSGLDGKQGVLELQRDHAATLAEHSTIIEQHTKQIAELKGQDGAKAKSTIQTLNDKALQLITLLLGSTIGGAITSRFFPHH